MNAIAGGIKFLHVTPHVTAILDHGHPVARRPLAGDIGDMFHVVEKGHGIVIGAERSILPLGIKNRSSGESKPKA